jgi:hypothetical protein
MSILDIILITLGHFIGDFIFQSRDMGRRKSENSSVLVLHGLILFGIIAPITLFLNLSLWFAVSNSILHMLIDWFIWRGYKLRMSKNINRNYWEDKCFYLVIGLDQYLHYLTIFILYSIFK